MSELATHLEEKIKGLGVHAAPDDVKVMLKEIQAEHGIKGKNLFMGSRVLLTGHMHGSDINNMLALIGKEKLLQRLEKAKGFL